MALVAVCKFATLPPPKPLTVKPPDGSEAAHDSGDSVTVPSLAIETWKFHGPFRKTFLAVLASGNFIAACHPLAPAGNGFDDRFLTAIPPS